MAVEGVAAPLPASRLGASLATISEVADHGMHQEARSEWQVRTPSVAIPLAELRAATANFGEGAKVGEGGFASVYCAAHLPSLPGIVEVAIKKLLTAYYLLLTATHCLLLTTSYYLLLLTTRSPSRSSLPTTYYLLRTTYLLLLATYYLLPTTYYLLLTRSPSRSTTSTTPRGAALRAARRRRRSPRCVLPATSPNPQPIRSRSILPTCRGRWPCCSAARTRTCCHCSATASSGRRLALSSRSASVALYRRDSTRPPASTGRACSVWASRRCRPR